MTATPPLNLVLIAPQIPHNTGAAARLAVGLGARLHLIRPLGFSLSESRVKRAGLDYWQHTDLVIHDSWDHYLNATQPEALLFISTRGKRCYLDCTYTAGTHLLFGNETQGLPAEFYERYAEQLVRIPMPGEHARSIAIVAYEAYRQMTPDGWERGSRSAMDAAP